MKNLISSAFKRPGKTIWNSRSVPAAWSAQPLFYLIALVCTFLFSACKKYTATEINDVARSARTNSSNEEIVNGNAALPAQTVAELFKVRAATEKYMDTAAARADGYVPVITLPNMGLHFAKFGLVGSFDLAHPPFLVYNKLPNGKFQLVAVEYGVPIDPQHTDIPPAGFTGDADQWDFNTLNLGLWTLHAWVWKANPNGVFAMTNPNVP